jgi:hypothetical protein
MRKLFQDDSGQNTFEYMLLIGGFALLFAAALMTAFLIIIPRLLELACPTIDPLGSGNCLT